MASSILVSCNRVLPEHRARADQIVLRQCKKKARQVQYEVLYVAISTYHHDYLGVEMTKDDARRMGITLDKDEFLKVTMPLCHYAFIMPLCFHYVGVTKLVLWKRRVLCGIGGSLV